MPDQFIHCGFGSWWEVFLDINLADSLTQAAFNQADRSLPAWPIHRLSGELGAIEAKALVNKTGR